MPDPTALETAESETSSGEPSPFQIALGFFILPMLLVFGAIAVFLTFGVLAHEEVDPAKYLAEVNGRGINEPWQAAFHLSQQLQFDESLRSDPEFARQVVAAMERADDGDPRVRRFLAIALGRMESDAAVPTLIDHTADEDPEVRINSMWALGSIGEASAAPAVARQLRDDDVGVRTMATYVLGVLRNPETAGGLQVALNDPVPAVRWNAAVALGLMKDPAGLELLERMIDREYLTSVPETTEEDQRQTMLAALRALEALGTHGLEEDLERIRDEDPDLTVRDAARQALAASTVDDTTSRASGSISDTTTPRREA